MALPDASEVDAAIIAKLVGDAPLQALMPDGVYFDVSGSGKTRFVIVSLVTHADDYMFNTSAYEQSVYLIKAVSLNTSGGDVKAAAARIHTLLQDAVLTITGYTSMVLQREERVRYTEVDSVNADIRWQHRGGRYALWVSP